MLNVLIVSHFIYTNIPHGNIRYLVREAYKVSGAKYLVVDRQSTLVPITIIRDHLHGPRQEHMSRQGASNYVEWRLHLRAFSTFRIRTVLDYGEYPPW